MKAGCSSAKLSMDDENEPDFDNGFGGGNGERRINDSLGANSFCIFQSAR